MRNDNTHVLVVPYPAQGHIIPLLELSRRLVSQGLKVTFIVTNFSHGKVRDCEKSTIVKMALIEDGLCTEEREKPGRLSEWVLKDMPRKVEELVDEINGDDEEMIIGCVIGDHTLGWAMDIAERKGIRRAAFFPAAAANMAPGFSIPRLIDNGIIDNDGVVLKIQTIKVSPEMPCMNTSNLAWANFANKQMRKSVFTLMCKNNISTQKADRLICNSTYDLEPTALNLVPQILIPVGPLLSNDQDLADLNGSLKWLDRQTPNSVIYIAFGSFAALDSSQIRELALGLELSKRPFLWVKKSSDDNCGQGIDFPLGFLERVGDRGMVVSKWIPQQKVLRHSSVACFVSHCGWNSTVEGVASGLTFICWPCFGDQFLNRSYLCDIWRVGLGLNRDALSGLIVREEIMDKLEKVFGDGEMRVRALALKEKLNGCVGKINNSRALVEWIKS